MTSFCPGDGVQICNLISRGDLNGRSARVRQKSGDRWIVVLETVDLSDSGVVKVRPENLKLLQTCKVWSQSLNGKAVAIQKQGDYLVAEDIWTGVLDILEHSDDIETVKVLYSNRSACRLKRGVAKLALADAEKCVEMDVKWEKGWLRKIDAVEALGEIVRAYDVALDASKILGFAMDLSKVVSKFFIFPHFLPCFAYVFITILGTICVFFLPTIEVSQISRMLPKNTSQSLQKRLAELKERPETQGYLRDEQRQGMFCCACNKRGGSFSSCSKCTMVSYCGDSCKDGDARIHEKVCKALQAVCHFDEIHASGRLWRGCCDASGQVHEYRILIDGVRRFQFPLLIEDRSARAKSMTSWSDWVNLMTSNQISWARDPINQIMKQDDFRRIMLGDSLQSKEETVLHQISTDIASFPLTLFHALRSFGFLRNEKVRVEPLIIHVIGAEADKEAAYSREIQCLLQTLIGLTPILLVYIGPLNSKSGRSLEDDAQHFHNLRTRKELGSASSFFFRGTYADFLCSPMYSQPDMVMAFHPGFHDGTYPWWPTLQFLLHENVPLALTCFSEKDLQETLDMFSDRNPVYGAKIVYGQSDSKNPFASQFLVPAVEGTNLLRSSNLYLLGLNGIWKRFPKGGGILDGSHMETMALSVAMSIMNEEGTQSPTQQADLYILKERARSYVKFANALQKIRPCVGHTMVSEENPEAWRMVTAAIG